MLEFLLVRHHVHRRARQHIRRADQYGESHLVDELVDVVDGGQLAPARLVDAQRVAHGREFLPVLGAVDVDWRCAEDRDVAPVEFHCQIVGNLSAHRHYDAFGVFEVDDVEHALLGQFVEVEAVADVVVGADRFGVIVDHDRSQAFFLDGVDGVDRAPVELDRRADAVGARAEHHHRAAVAHILDVVFGAAVGQIEVVDLRGELACHGVDLLHHRRDVAELAVFAHFELLLLHAAAIVLEDDAGYLEVAESFLLGGGQQFVGDVADAVVFREFGLQVGDVLELVEEPQVDFGELVYFLHADALLQCLGDGEDALVGGRHELFAVVAVLERLVGHESVHALAHHAQAFLDDFFKVAADGHDFADALHA